MHYRIERGRYKQVCKEASREEATDMGSHMHFEQKDGDLALKTRGMVIRMTVDMILGKA